MRVDSCRAHDPPLTWGGATANLPLRPTCRTLIRTRYRSRRAPVVTDETDVTEPSHELERPVSAGF